MDTLYPWFDQPSKEEEKPMFPMLPLTVDEIIDSPQFRWAGKQRHDYIKLLLANENWAATHPFDLAEAVVMTANTILVLTQGK